MEKRNKYASYMGGSADNDRFYEEHGYEDYHAFWTSSQGRPTRYHFIQTCATCGARLELDLPDPVPAWKVRDLLKQRCNSGEFCKSGEEIS